MPSLTIIPRVDSDLNILGLFPNNIENTFHIHNLSFVEYYKRYTKSNFLLIWMLADLLGECRDGEIKMTLHFGKGTQSWLLCSRFDSSAISFYRSFMSCGYAERIVQFCIHKNLHYDKT